MMARAPYRLRSDGVLEIVRPRRWTPRGARTRAAAGLLGILLATVAAAAIYAAVGIPLLIVALCSVIAVALWRRGARGRRPAPQRIGPVRRTAP